MSQNESSEKYFSTALVGTLMIFLSAVGFSAKAVIIKLAYQLDVDPITLLSLRMAFSLPFFVMMAVYGEMCAKERISGRDALNLMVLGLIGYYLSSLMDFEGLQYVSAGLERLILFLYPTFVVLLSAAFLGRKITKRDAIALVMSYVGVALAVSHDIASRGNNTLFGSLVIFGCAVSWAVYLVGADKMMNRIGAVRFTGYAMVASTVAVLIHYGATRGEVILRQSSEVYKLSLVMAILSTVLPVLLLSGGLRRIGASKTAMISSVGPVFTIFLAYIFLGEKISALQLAGTAMIIGGVLSVKNR